MIVAFMRAGYAQPKETEQQSKAGGYEHAEKEKNDNKVEDNLNGDHLKELDLRSNMLWPLRNQLSIPACTAYAAMACVELFLAVKNKKRTNQRVCRTNQRVCRWPRPIMK